jgi:transcriptional regulator with XRE-family HTH domain
MAKTPKAVALGNALRQARLEKGLKLREFATQINRDPAMLSRWETGDRTPRPEQVSQILAVLGVNGDKFDEIMTLVYGTDEPQWVATSLPEQRQQLAAFLEFEQNAVNIIELSPLLIPGLLQTTEYIRAVMSGGSLSPTDITTRTAIRVGRREVIDINQSKPVPLMALMGQGALYQNVGGKAVMLAQLRHLLKVARYPHVDLRIIPFGAGWHPGLESSFMLIESNHPATVVFLETRRSNLWLHTEADINAYRHAIDMVLRVALSADQSIRFIAELAQRMETRSDVPDHLA